MTDEVTDALHDKKAPTAIRLLAIGGYPYTGKTRLAEMIAARWRGPAFVLPTESVVHDRSSRLSAHQDGSAVDAHDIDRLMAYVDRLRRGEEVDIPVYSWQVGRSTHSHRAPSLGMDGLVILDGSIATASPIRDSVDMAVAMRPRQLESWIRNAVARDIAERSWNETDAWEQNWQKAATVEAQLDGFTTSPPHRILTVDQDSAAWTVQQ